MNWKIKEAFRILKSPVILDSAALFVGTQMITGTEYMSLGHNRNQILADSYGGQEVTAAVAVAFTLDGKNFKTHEGKVQGRITYHSQTS